MSKPSNVQQPAITAPGIPPAMAPAVGVPMKAPMPNPCTSYCAGGNPVYGFHPVSNTPFGFGDHRTTVTHAQMYVNMHADDTEVERDCASSSDASAVVSDWDRQMMKKYRAEGWTDGERESEWEGGRARKNAAQNKKAGSPDSDDSDEDSDSDDDTLATEDVTDLNAIGRVDEESPLTGHSKNNTDDENEFVNPENKNAPGGDTNSPFSFSSAWAQDTFFSIIPGSSDPGSRAAAKKDQSSSTTASKDSSWRNWFPTWMRCAKRNPEI